MPGNGVGKHNCLLSRKKPRPSNLGRIKDMPKREFSLLEIHRVNPHTRIVAGSPHQILRQPVDRLDVEEGYKPVFVMSPLGQFRQKALPFWSQRSGFRPIDFLLKFRVTYPTVDVETAQALNGLPGVVQRFVRSGTLIVMR